MNKKWPITALALTVLTAGLAGCGGAKEEGSKEEGKQGSEAPANVNATDFPIVKEKLNLNIAAFKPPSGKDLNDYKIFKDIEEKTNIHINWDLTPGSSWNEKKNLLFAGGELPDAFYAHGILSEDTDIVKYGSQGILIPLEELIDKYAPNVKKLLQDNPTYKKQLTAPDGHIYSLPTIDEGYSRTKSTMFINKKWLDELKLPMPTTTDELYQTLKAFKDNDLGGNSKKDQIPLSFLQNWNSDVNSFFGAFGRIDRDVHKVGNNHLSVENDKVVYTAVLPEYKEAIQYFNKLFAEGLADQESFTQDTKVLNAKESKGLVGVTFNWNPANQDYVSLPPLKGPNGKEPVWAEYANGILLRASFAITSKNKHPEATMRWIDYMYDPKISMQFSRGVIGGDSLKERTDGKFDAIPLPQGGNEEEFKQVPPTAYSVWALTKPVYDMMVTEPGKVRSKIDIDNVYGKYLVDNAFPKTYFTAEESDQISRYLTDIDSYVSKMYAKWMMSGGIDKEWDEYVKKLNDMGLEKMMKIYQQAYDRYKTTK
ncbi:extracellular solute-binding protein [Paenibacillus contaminans]|uniref:Sugar ABC transporter substrate-binding protein n=1 Tax=Paenibacillus contaminans TaxID=450362 RepID=A0A329M2U3_9BACL|nr:extracellular solute-binding protein [Paenibacillus contaminans]RAV11257.1 sugar ABC transporter substrate-binding protein [Paenibacillus contaminans]